MNNKTEHIDKAIEKGISFLAEHQFHHGEFCIYMGEGDNLEKWCIPDSTTFTSALIGSLLIPLKNYPAVEKMLNKVIPFLLYQKMRGGTWNFFTKWHKMFSLCPPDVDSTACISSFLKDMQTSFPDNLQMILANRNKKGLFYTWFTIRFNLRAGRSQTYWKLVLRELKHPVKSILIWKKKMSKRNDVDAVVNSNVLYYLGYHQYTDPVVNLLISIIEEGKESNCDKWYQNPFEVYYFISRNYAAGVSKLEPVKKLIIERIIASAQDNGSLGTSPVDTALGISTLIHFNYLDHHLLAQSVKYLIQSQAANGSWNMQALCGSGPVSPIVWGSHELSTAFSLAALAAYKKYEAERKISIHSAAHEVS